MEFLQENLAKGNIDGESHIYTSIYLLSKEDAILKEYEDELGYHIPDDIQDDIVSFNMGFCQGCSSEDSSIKGKDNSVLFSIYLKSK